MGLLWGLKETTYVASSWCLVSIQQMIGITNIIAAP